LIMPCINGEEMICAFRVPNNIGIEQE